MGLCQAGPLSPLHPSARHSKQTNFKASVRKTFKIQVEGKNPDRVLDAHKHEIRKYVKRERRVPLPAGVDFWDFECKFGNTEESAETVHLAEIITRIDAAVTEGAEQFFVEVIAKEGHRRVRPAGERPAYLADGFDEGDDDLTP
jgi:hypothetical protein